MDEKKKKQPAGDKSYIEEIAKDRPLAEESDLEGFQRRGDTYLTEEDLQNEQSTGREAAGLTMEEAIKAIARSEGIQYPEGDLEELYKRIREKKKKKSMPYEPMIDRPGI